MKYLRPQVIAGVIILGLIAYYSLSTGYDKVAILAVGGIVSAVTALSANGNNSP